MSDFDTFVMYYEFWCNLFLNEHYIYNTVLWGKILGKNR